MKPQPHTPSTLWREDSPIFEIVAGEFVLQARDPLAGDVQVLSRLAATRADEAARVAGDGDLDAVGHALIGCSVALALGARAEMGSRVDIETEAADLGAALSWGASQPTSEALWALAADLTGRVYEERKTPTLWELAVRAGSFAAGLSQHITRRRERRDLLDSGRV